MAISLKGTAGAWAGGTTAAAPTIPAHAVGDLIIVHVEAKPTSTGTPPVFSTPAGFTKIAEGTNGGGAAQGVDLGQTWHCSYYLIATATNHTISVTVTNGNVTLAKADVFQQSSTSHTWVTPVGVSVGDTTSATSYSLAGTLSVGLNDMIVVGCCLAGNTATYNATWTLSATGMTFGTVTKSGTDGTTNNGNDLASSACYALITAGTPATVTVTAANTLSAAQTGTGGIIRLRETAPTFTGTAAQTLPSLTQSATGTRTVPTSTGSATSTLLAVSQSATGTVSLPTYTGTASQTLPSLTQSATGTRTVPTFTGNASQSLPALSQTAAGTFAMPTFTGTASQTLPGVSQSASGSHVAPTYTGSASQSLPGLLQSAAGTHVAPSFTGTAAQTIPSLTQSAAGTATAPTYTGTSAQTLPGFTQSASGSHVPPSFTGNASQSLPAFTQTAAGSHTPPTFTAVAAQSLPALTQSAAGQVFAPIYTGELVQILPAFTQSAAGSFTAGAGQASQTLPSLTQSAAGSFTAPVFTGSATSVLAAVTQSAFYVVDPGAVTYVLRDRRWVADVEGRWQVSRLRRRVEVTELREAP